MSGYYQTRNALIPTYSHLRYQNFLGHHLGVGATYMSQGYHSNPP